MHRPRPDRKTLGFVLKALRKQRGFTQEQLALKSKITTPTISDTENGKHNLSFESIERWLNALGVTWTDFAQALDKTTGTKPRH